MKLTDGLRRSGVLFADEPATIFGERRQTWRELYRRVRRLAGGLVALGARPGDRIAILATNSDRYIEAYYAIAWAGCIAVGLNTRWAPAEIDYAFDDSRPTMLMFDAHFAHVGAHAAERDVIAIGMDDGAGSGPSFATLIADHDEITDRCTANDEVAVIFYTGGTTGRSRGVMLSHANLATNELAFHAVEPYAPRTVFLHIPPMFHCGDASCIFTITLLGGSHVVIPAFDPGDVVAAIERHQVTALFLVPTMIGMLAEAVRAHPADLSSIKRLTYGASAISEATLAQAMELFPRARLCQGYGLTELSPNATVLNHEDHLKGKLRSAGRAIPFAAVRIVDADLNEVASGVVGEVVVSGPGVMRGYLNQPEMTAQTIIGGWLRTGDAGYIDEEGYLFLVDRVKDLIVSGGENIYSAEVENALQQHDDVLQCAVIGIPDLKWGEAVHAVLFIREGSTLTAARLLDHCAPLIARYKQPKSFDLRTTPLPVSGVGKILKTELREPFWKGVTRRIG